MGFQRVFVAVQALGQITLPGDREDHDVALALQLLDQHLGAHDAGFVVVRPDEQQSLGAGRVRVDGDHRYALRDGGVNVRAQHGGIAHRNQDARGLLAQDALELVAFRLRIVGIRAHHFGFHLQLHRGLA